MKTKYIIAALALAFAGAVAAQPSNNCNGNGSCSQDTVNNTTNNTTNQGGTGIGVGIGIGQGGNAAAAASNTTNVGNGVGNFSPSARVDADLRNTNTNNNANLQGQQQQQKQQQQQGQQQGQTSVNVNTNKANADADSASASQAKAVNAGNAQSTTINTYNPGTIEYKGGYEVKSAPGIALGGPASGPCNGFSGGLAISGMGFGGALNASTVDESCVERETARMFGLLGQPNKGLELLESSDVWQKHLKRKAEAQKRAADEERMATVAAAQRVDRERQVATATKGTTVTPAAVGGADITDPYIRARMGLPK